MVDHAVMKAPNANVWVSVISRSTGDWIATLGMDARMRA
jgi:hypothetical protein